MSKSHVTFEKSIWDSSRTNVLWRGRNVGHFCRTRHGKMLLSFHSSEATDSCLFVPHFAEKTTAKMKDALKARLSD